MVFAAFNEALQHAGLRAHSDEEIYAMFGPDERGILQNLIGDGWEDVYAVYLAAYEREHADIVGPFPGIQPALDLMVERGVQLAIVTGKGADAAAISVPRFGLDRYFTIIESGSSRGPAKPAAIRGILERWQLPAHAVAYVGDAPQDVRDARETGLVAIGAGWAATTPLDALRAEQPDVLFETVEAFTAWLRAHV
jgi:phosphoglycolate phosphatase-like HAD superfamily hydrolase